MDFEAALRAHLEWKSRFLTAIRTGGTLDATEIGRDDRCALGQWLHGEARQRWGSTVQYAQALDAHRAFHVLAAGVAELITAGHHAQAAQAIGGGVQPGRRRAHAASRHARGLRPAGAAPLQAGQLRLH